MRTLLIAGLFCVIALSGCTEVIEDVKEKAGDAYFKFQENQGAPDWSSKPIQSNGGDQENENGQTVTVPHMTIEYDRDERTATLTEFSFDEPVIWVRHNQDRAPTDGEPFLSIKPRDGGCSELPTGPVAIGAIMQCDAGTKLNIEFQRGGQGDYDKIEMFFIEFASDDEPVMDSPDFTWDRDQPGKFVVANMVWNGADIAWRDGNGGSTTDHRYELVHTINDGSCTTIPVGVVGVGDTFACESGTRMSLIFNDALNPDVGGLLVMHTF